MTFNELVEKIPYDRLDEGEKKKVRWISDQVTRMNMRNSTKDEIINAMVKEYLQKRVPYATRKEELERLFHVYGQPRAKRLGVYWS